MLDARADPPLGAIGRPADRADLPVTARQRRRRAVHPHEIEMRPAGLLTRVGERFAVGEELEPRITEPALRVACAAEPCIIVDVMEDALVLPRRSIDEDDPAVLVIERLELHHEARALVVP